MSDIKSGIQYLFQTQNRTTFAVSGTGHTAMECAIFNTVESGESVLVAVNGIWGERAADMGERVGKSLKSSLIEIKIFYICIGRQISKFGDKAYCLEIYSEPC